MTDSTTNQPSVDPAYLKRSRKIAQRNRRKDYWGATPLLMSLMILLIFFIAGAIALGVYEAIQYANGTATLGDISNSKKLTAVLTNSPIVILLSTIPMYMIWVACELWVTKYRSQLGVKFKSFWAAFKNNFAIYAKWYDPFLGIGIGLAFVGFQSLILWLIPTVFPAFDIKDSDNTGIFADQSGIAFYALGYGLVSILGPIMEELYFRGFILHGLINHFSVRGKGTGNADTEDQLYEVSQTAGTMFTTYRLWAFKHRNIISITLTAILFGAFHFQSLTPGGLLTCLITACLGFVNGLVVVKLNRLTPAIFSHITNNMFAIILLTFAH